MKWLLNVETTVVAVVAGDLSTVERFEVQFGTLEKVACEEGSAATVPED